MTYRGSINLNQVASRRVFQRSVREGNPAGNWKTAYGKGWATVTLSIVPTVPASLIEYRVRDAADLTGEALLGWTTCAQEIGSDLQEIEIELAARLGWYVVDLRANGDDSSTIATSQIGVGEVVAASGQSLATDFWSTAATGDTTSNASCGVAPSPYGTCLASWDGNPAPGPNTSWITPGDTSIYRSTFCAEFLRLAVVGTGVNCALIGYAWSGQPISSWDSEGRGPKDVWARLTATLDGAVGQGGFGTFIWAHGHNDARIAQPGIDGDQLTSDQYIELLGSLFSRLQLRYGPQQFGRILSSVPAIGANWISTTPKYVSASIEQIRQAHLRYALEDPLVWGHVDGLDVPLWSDETHPSQRGNIVYARHFYRAFMTTMGTPVYSDGDKGPSLHGYASRELGGDKVLLWLQRKSATPLVCGGGSEGASTQFKIFKSGSVLLADQLAIVSVELWHNDAIMLTMASIPPDDQPLDVWYRLPPDSGLALLPANQIYDGNTGEIAIDGIDARLQLAMCASSITVPAPTWRVITLADSGVPMLIDAGSIVSVL